MFGVDIFNDDAFSMAQLTAAINEMDRVPGSAGQRAFVGNIAPISTYSVAIEMKNQTLELIQTTVRGGPSEKEVRDDRTMRAFNVPHLQLEDAVQASSVQNVREFGTEELRSVESAVHTQMRKMVARHDLTLEYHRLGAIRGEILDADGSVLLNLFAGFGIMNSLGQFAPETFSLDLSSGAEDVRVQTQRIIRYMIRNAKTLLPQTPEVWAFCGDDFFDALVSNESIKRTFAGHESAAERLGGNYSNSVFDYAGVFWENYQGTDDGQDDPEGGTVGIATDECRFFLGGSTSGIWAEHIAPGDFLETVNKPGLPLYAKLAVGKYGKAVELHTQQNPLPLCLRPRTLVRGVMA